MIKTGKLMSIKCIDVFFNKLDKAVSTYCIKSASGDAALFDTGTPRNYNLLKKELENFGVTGDNLTKVIISHVHLDHCGNTKLLARDFPKATFYVHPLGIKHLVEPDILIEQSKIVMPDPYEDEYCNMYGGIERDRIKAVEDNSTIDFDGGSTVKIIYTPGHCLNHIAVIEPDTRVAFTGDAFGTRFDHIIEGLTFASTSPPQFDPDTFKQSAKRILEEDIDTVALTHFGFHSNIQPHYEQLVEWCDLMKEVVKSEDDIKDAVYDAFLNKYSYKLNESWNRLRMDVIVNTKGIVSYAKRLERMREKESKK